MSWSTACKAVLAAWACLACAAAHGNCWREAGGRHGVDPLLLYSIAKVESSLNPKAVNHNRNGTQDIGLMQINSIHLPGLAQRGITRQQLLDDPCLSIEAGAEILAGFIKRFGYTWRAVGAYNAGGADNREDLRKRYVGRVWQHYLKLAQVREATRRQAQLVRQ
ncbi:lytic transglycosylase domain-containing protein [Achromobacter seleniivolatilans]|uniref:lytic transglycosylase domain-containing protein n=1 Tax=Achromobacter seleniivolatilans TaxID=3047478 RepID=UPI003529A959